MWKIYFYFLLQANLIIESVFLVKIAFPICFLLKTIINLHTYDSFMYWLVLPLLDVYILASLVVSYSFVCCLWRNLTTYVNVVNIQCQRNQHFGCLWLLSCLTVKIYFLPNFETKGMLGCLVFYYQRNLHLILWFKHLKDAI